MTTAPPMTLPSDAQAQAEGCWFDAELAAKKIAWMEAVFAFTLYHWQRSALTMYFGWHRPDGTPEGTYRFTEISIWIPKKNGKTCLIAALAGMKLFELKNARIYSCAFNSNQARIVMEELIKLCRNSPTLRKRMKSRTGSLKAFCSPFRRDMTNEHTNSRYIALSDNVSANDGLIADILIIDEIHRMKNAQVDVVEGAVLNNPKALKVIISTAGSGDKAERSWERYQEAKRVLSGKVMDTRLLPIIYECPAADKLKGEEIYDLDLLTACNPVLQQFSEKREQAAREMVKARSNRADNHWRRFRLNQWCREDGDEYISTALYADCEVPQEPDLNGRDVYVGLDKTGGQWDFTAITLLFPLDDGRLFEKHYCFASADRIADMTERDERPYARDIENGELILIPGDAVADDFLYNWTKTEFAKYNIKKIAADIYNASNLLERWKYDGLDVFAVQQSNNRALSPVIEDLRRRTAQSRIIHTRNHLVMWQLSCARAITTAQDVLKIVKAKSNRKGKGGAGHIDSIDALINALAARRVDEIVESTRGDDAGITIG